MFLASGRRISQNGATVFDKIKDALNSIISGDDDAEAAPFIMDKKLCAATLMVHVMVADGKIKPEEEAKLLDVLETHYEMTADQAAELAEQARKKQSESIDLYSFTSIIKAKMSETERMGLIEDLWEMVYADGTLHEFEDNIVWRVAELIGINSDRRMALKRLVRDRTSAQQADA